MTLTLTLTLLLTPTLTLTLTLTLTVTVTLTLPLTRTRSQFKPWHARRSPPAARVGVRPLEAAPVLGHGLCAVEGAAGALGVLVEQALHPRDRTLGLGLGFGFGLGCRV